MATPRSPEWAVLERGHRILERAVRTPAHITAIYLTVGLLALFMSDILLVWFFEDPFLAELQIVKGALEVLLTAGLIYFLTTISRSSLQRLSEDRKRQREELSVLHRVLRHNLRNDINLVHGHATDLEAEVSDPAASERARVVSEKTADMLEYTTRAGRLRQINAADGCDPIDLRSTVERVIGETDAIQSQDVEVDADLGEACPVVANHMLETAISELLTNAVEHHDGPAPEIAVSLNADGRRPGCAELVITDDGPGMPEMVIEAMSESGPDQLVHLDGMGLWFVYLTVRESGGEVSIESSGDGTTVRLDIPKPARRRLPKPRALMPGQ
jgi:signal transduction histidine kinase